MGTRTDDLDEIAAPVAARLQAEYGNLKHVLSAAVLAFDWLLPDYQKVFLARAGGQEAEIPLPTEEKVRDHLSRILALSQIQAERTARDHKAKSVKFG